MNVFKKWYFEWLNTNKQELLNEQLVQEVKKFFSEYDKELLIKCWIEKHGSNCIGYTTFVSACANDAYLVDALVDSIMRKQLK